MKIAEPSLYDQIGGVTGVTRMVDDFYARVMADEALAPYFQNAPMPKLRSMQVELFAAALDGPVTYSGRSIAHAHHHLAITLADYQRFVSHLFNTLAGCRFSDQDSYEIIGRLNLFTNDVVSAGTGIVG